MNTKQKNENIKNDENSSISEKEREEAIKKLEEDLEDCC
jgi:hypothetical protein